MDVGWIRNEQNSCVQGAAVNGLVSKRKPVVSGVPQVPTVTTLFINNISSGFAGCPQSLKKSADGTKLSDNAQGKG